jgi:hypothetical protein
MSRKRRHHKAKPVSFDPVAGAAARDEGVAQALTSQVAIPCLAQAHAWLMQRLEPFTCDDIVAAIGLPFGGVGQHRNNAVGAFIVSLSRSKAIVAIGYKPSDRKECHRHVNRVWARA